ncbi:MAG TPA: hypothetical protein DCW78_05210, partial [Pseudomonas sp.]|nr:hypothetical protein [Pseudomonas sp.]
DACGDWPAECLTLTARSGSGPHWLFSGSLPAAPPAAHYTARVIPAAYDGLRVPLELPLILWQP